MIAHRIWTVRSAGTIVVLENVQIAQSGLNVQDLLNAKDGSCASVPQRISAHDKTPRCSLEHMDISAASKAVAHFIEPGNLLALLLATGAALQWTSYTRLGCWLTLTGALGVLAIVVLPIDQWLASPLENRFPAPAMAAP